MSGPSCISALPFSDAPGVDVPMAQTSTSNVHRLAILVLVSPVFRDMFTLPQPESSPSIPSVAVQEASAFFNRALRFFYPGAQPVVGTLDELREISKYDIQHQCVVPTTKVHLEMYLTTQPVAVYAIAFNHEWKECGGPSIVNST
jgi:hypothetical protein